MPEANKIPDQPVPAGELDLLAILEQNVKQSERIAELERLLRRPLEVKLQDERHDAQAWEKFMAYMPHLSLLSTNAAEIAGALKNSSTPTALTLVAIDSNLKRIANALERLVPEEDVP